MWGAAWRIELRKTVPAYVGWLVGMAFGVLFISRPLGPGDMAPAMMGVSQGFCLAIFLFRELPGTASFMFSRPFSRARLFWYRWALGLGLQAVALAVLAALLASGAREAFQVHLRGSVWYPMVKWHELSVLGTIAVWSLVAYQTTCFLVVRNALLRGGQAPASRRWPYLVAMAAVALALLAMLAGCVGAVHMAGPIPSRAPAFLPDIVLQAVPAYLAVLTVLTTLSSLYCYRHLEVSE